jgi:hypothetical protein
MNSLMKAENGALVMNNLTKFWTILLFGGLLSLVLPIGPAAAKCADEIAFVEALARAEGDWLRRETTLAILTEAKRDALRGREMECHASVGRARMQLRGQAKASAGDVSG